MTNADRFLKDGVSVEEVAKEFESFCEMLNEACIIPTYKQEMEQFLNCEIQPTLTEDERAILRNISKEYKYISKQIETGDLFITEKKDGMGIGICIYEFNHLFQFIKERRRISNRGVVEMILFEKYCGRERYEAWTRVFNNTDELITFLQEHKEHLLSTPDGHKHFKIVATMYNKGEIGEFLGFNE